MESFQIGERSLCQVVQRAARDLWRFDIARPPGYCRSITTDEV
jgi:hypothetical protein